MKRSKSKEAKIKRTGVNNAVRKRLQILEATKKSYLRDVEKVNKLNAELLRVKRLLRRRVKQIAVIKERLEKRLYDD